MEDTADHSVYEGLLALLKNEFPKVCSRCGREYPSLESFVDQTLPTHTGTGLMGYDMGAQFQQVAMMRNCVCGSTLMTFCCDRRDCSEAGLRRRAMFEKLLEQLQAHGIEAITARHELLAFLRGERSPVLEKLGIFSRPHSLQPAA